MSTKDDLIAWTSQAHLPATFLQGIFEHQALYHPICPSNLATLLVSLCSLNTHVHICTQVHMYNTYTPRQKKIGCL